MSWLSNFFNSVASTVNPSTVVGAGLGGGVGGVTGSQSLGNILTGQDPTTNVGGGLSADALGLAASPFAAAGTAALGGTTAAAPLAGAGEFAGLEGAGGAYDAANLTALEAGDLGGGVFGTTPVTTPGVLGGLTGTQLGALALAGKLGAGALGLVGANRRASDQQRQQAEFAAMSEPYRLQLEELYRDPSRFLSNPAITEPIQQGTTQLARSLSTQGNPSGSGNALQAIQNYASTKLSGALGDEKSRLAALSGIPNYNAAAPGASQESINAKSGIFNVLGGTLYDVTNPQPSLEQILARIRSGGWSN